MLVNAILFDIRSVQKYIFAGNKLKTNVGASFITCNLFQPLWLDEPSLTKNVKSLLVDEVLTDMAEAGQLGTFDKDSWPHIKVLDNLPADCFVAQAGGGKALILFRKSDDYAADREKLKTVVRNFNRAVLERYPGLHTGAAIGTINLDKFMDSEDKLFDLLKENQNTIYPIVNVPFTGLTLTCDVNGEAATHYQDNRWISQEVYAKEEKGKEANRVLREIFSEECARRDFPLEISQLGQRQGENYFAIVHIDGNKMGVKFQECKKKPPERQFAEYNGLALRVRKKTREAFRAVLRYIDANYKRFGRGHDRLDLQGDYMPIRPLIFGGDDIAFVCAAKIALELTAFYMREMIKGDESTRLYTCAGVAILPTSYPFFRGYQLAEQLCSSAKKKSRPLKENSCWLDFAVLHGEQSPTFEQMLKNEYSGAQGSLHFGPYRVDSDDGQESLTKLIEGVEAFDVLPQNKIKEMRNVITRDEHSIAQFTEQLKHDDKAVPHIDGWEQYEEKLWSIGQDGKMCTPYVDVIEMRDFYIPKDDVIVGGDDNE